MKYHYSDGVTRFGELTQAQVRERMAASPGGKHLVWQEGWQSWKDARDVFPPPVVPVSSRVYHYADGTTKHGVIPEEEVLARVAKNPTGTHLVWQEEWSSWRPAGEVFPSARNVVPPSAPDEVQRSVPAAAGTDSPAAGGARRNKLGMWLGIGAAATLLIVLLAVFLGGSDEDFVGYYTATSADSEAFLQISKVSDEKYRIQGEALIGTSREYGPNIGTLDIEAAVVGDELHGKDAPDYIIRIKRTPEGIEADESGENENFGMNVGFAFTYAKSETMPNKKQGVTASSGDDSQETAYEAEEHTLEITASRDFSGEALDLAGSWWASSTLEDNETKYGVVNISDDNARTVWAEGNFGDGSGARLEFTPNESDIGTIYGFRMLNGHCRTRKLWEAHARVRRMRVHSGSAEHIVELIDTPDWQYVSLGGFAVRGSIEFEILEVYPGSKYEDLTISELNIIWELQSGGF
jgi:hypothetical protein